MGYPSEKQLRKWAKTAKSACNRNPDDVHNWKRRGVALLMLKPYGASVEELYEAKKCLETAHELKELPKDVHTLFHLGMTYIALLGTDSYIQREEITVLEKLCNDGIGHFENLEEMGPVHYGASSRIRRIKQLMAKEKMRRERILEKPIYEEKSTKEAALKLSGSLKSRRESIVDAITLLDQVLSKLPKDNPAEKDLLEGYDMLVKECRPRQGY